MFASLVNGAASGKFLATLIVGLHSVAKSGSGAVMLLIGLALVFHFLVWMFVKRNYLVVLRRLTLESQHYDKTPFSRFRFLFKNRRWLNTAVTLMLTSLFHFLWSLTVAGAELLNDGCLYEHPSREALEGRAYPARLFPRPAKEKRSKAVHLNYDRHYAITSLILMYFIFAVFGWVWEVTIGFVQGACSSTGGCSTGRGCPSTAPAPPSSWCCWPSSAKSRLRSLSWPSCCPAAWSTSPAGTWR